MNPDELDESGKTWRNPSESGRIGLNLDESTKIWMNPDELDESRRTG
jgi:hypothetical protein